ncbi:MAG TPA: hypothetical protein VNQ90_20095 [Chthoniobacteraceae bacterium]|nr:hypothetical protein [Chthoniobacteraceae bacterium]
MKKIHSDSICRRVSGLLAATLFSLPNPGNAAETRLPNTREMNLSAAEISIDGREIYIDNARALSDKTNFDDYLKLHYRLYPKTHNILPKNIDIIKNIGIYMPSDRVFIKDPSVPISIIDATGVARTANTWFSAAFDRNANNSVTPITLNMTQGSSLSVVVRGWTSGFNLRLTHVGTGESVSHTVSVATQADSLFIYPRMPIFRSGKYYLRMVPIDQSSFTTDVMIQEANLGPTRAIENNQPFSIELDGTSAAYVKMKVHLRVDECVIFSVNSLSLMSTGGVVVLGSDGRFISRSFLQTNDHNYGYAAMFEDDYYFVINGWDFHAGGTTHVTTLGKAWTSFGPNISINYLGR